MYVRREDLELARKALKQMEVMEEKLISAWADAWFINSVGYFTRADARVKAGEKFRKEVQTFSYTELEDYKTSIEESIEYAS